MNGAEQVSHVVAAPGPATLPGLPLRAVALDYGGYAVTFVVPRNHRGSRGCPVGGSLGFVPAVTVSLFPAAG